MNYISFPGLGIDEFPLKKAAFNVFGRDIVWYGIIITIGILLAVAYVCYRAKKDEGIKIDDVFDYAIYLVFFGVIGARLYYVLMEFDSYKGKTIGQTLMNMIAIWEGGLAIYGGIIAGAIALLCVSLYKKINVRKAFDMVSPAVMIGQILGRWGNFFNAEAYGRETTLPWRMGIRAPGEEQAIFVHPTFLYESLWNLVGFILINLFYRKKRYDGQVFVMYITWYGFGRMFIEGLRTDSLYVGDFRISQVIAFICFFFGLAILTAMEIVHHLRAAEIRKANALANAAVVNDDEPVEEESENCTSSVEQTDTEDIDDTAQSTLEEDTNEVSKEISEEPDGASEDSETEDQQTIDELNESEEVSELMTLDGITDISEAENENSESETAEESDENEMFEISGSYSDEDDEE